MANEQISLPSLLVVVVVSGLILRYLFSSSAPPIPQSSRSPEAARRAREAAAERIQQMFPQADRRSILWDLQRNGGNIQNTTERVLAGRLETPPISFQPAPPPGSTSSGGASSTRPQPQRPSQPDLITRYNLSEKLSTAAASTSSEAGSDMAAADKKGKGWSSNRDERQASLQKRRDEMILAARKKMEAKLAAEKTGGQGS